MASMVHAYMPVQLRSRHIVIRDEKRLLFNEIEPGTYLWGLVDACYVMRMVVVKALLRKVPLYRIYLITSVAH